MNGICTWDPVADVDGYNVYLNGAKHNTSLITDTEYILPDLPVQEHEAYVVSVKDGIESAPSNVKSFEVTGFSPTHSLIFNGSDEYVDSGITSYGPLLNEITVEFWFICGTTSPARILGVTEEAGHMFFTIKFNTTAFDGSESGKIQLLIRDDSGNIMKRGLENSQSFTGNGWHHFAVSKASDNTTRMFLDGTELAVEVGDADDDLTNLIELTFPIFIGANNLRGSVNFPFRENMYDVRFWSVVRTPQQIIDNMNTKVESSEPGLFANYLFTDGAGDVAIDEVGNHHGTIVGNTDDEMWSALTPY